MQNFYGQTIVFPKGIIGCESLNYGVGVSKYRSLYGLCFSNGHTTNKKFFPKPVEDPYLAQRNYSHRTFNRSITLPEDIKSSNQVMENNEHPEVYEMYNVSRCDNRSCKSNEDCKSCKM
ncbi:MAG: hypothetical protein JKX76_01290 [Colwellia sp.]|nr:hypothetical protein [Colwellia sp.]